MTDFLNVFAGWLIDGTGGHIRENVLLNVQNGQIASIKERQDYDPNVPDIEDLSHCTILPGLIDSHVHVFMSGTSNPEIRKHQLNAPFRDMKKVISKHLFQQLSHGIVAVRDGGDYAGHALRYKKECLSSENLPIFLMSADKAWRAPGRYGKLIGRPPEDGISLSQSIAEVNEGSDHIKIVNSGLNSLTTFGKETLPQFSADQLKEAVRTADDLGLRIMVHANGDLPVKHAIEAGCHSIEHGFFMGKDNLMKLADRGIIWVPTAFTMKAYCDSLDIDSKEKDVSRKNLDHQLDQIAMAMKYGVSIAAGTDCGSLGVHHGSALREELGLLMQAGMSLEMAVQCATLNGAKALGLENYFGKVSPGMPATFIAVDSDPPSLFDALHKPVKIFTQGREWKPAVKEL
ncbi:MAG: amidohydrolase family protein [Deltaproteobacteria bacterium]|nr:amidohydrolase family protein [Deltaproteobacteria bacterium]